MAWSIFMVCANRVRTGQYIFNVFAGNFSVTSDDQQLLNAIDQLAYISRPHVLTQSINCGRTEFAIGQAFVLNKPFDIKCCQRWNIIEIHAQRRNFNRDDIQSIE